MAKNFSFYIGVIFITAAVSLAVGEVGEAYSSSGVYGWGLPLTVLIVTALPFILGLIAGKTSD